MLVVDVCFVEDWLPTFFHWPQYTTHIYPLASIFCVEFFYELLLSTVLWINILHNGYAKTTTSSSKCGGFCYRYSRKRRNTYCSCKTTHAPKSRPYTRIITMCTWVLYSLSVSCVVVFCVYVFILRCMISLILIFVNLYQYLQ